MKINLISFITLIVLTNCNYQNNAEKKLAQDSIQTIAGEEDCEPCCNSCRLLSNEEVIKEVDNSTRVIYLFQKGFEDVDCCIYQFGEYINNAVFEPKYDYQYIFLLDVEEVSITPKSKSLLPKSLKEYVIAQVYYDTTQMILTWDPNNTGKYEKFTKYKDL